MKVLCCIFHLNIRIILKPHCLLIMGCYSLLIMVCYLNYVRTSVQTVLPLPAYITDKDSVCVSICKTTTFTKVSCIYRTLVLLHPIPGYFNILVGIIILASPNVILVLKFPLKCRTLCSYLMTSHD